MESDTSPIAASRSTIETDADGDVEMNSDNDSNNLVTPNKDLEKALKIEPNANGNEDNKMAISGTHMIEVVGIEPVASGDSSVDNAKLNTINPVTSTEGERLKDKEPPIEGGGAQTDAVKKRTIASDMKVSEKVESSEPEAPKPRLVIERLVLTNFKSYAGKQIVGPFHPSFSAVVGPNGSGKSNVIDSLLFVFGFRASKMRQSKLKKLIHNSEQFKNLPFCRVDVHFKKVLDKSDARGRNYTEDVPNSQLIVSRKALRNNSSVYYVNNHTSNFTRVRSILKGEGIDLDHKRFLILQGEVESIAQMKPKAEKDSDDGLLEYLEDIIGTSKYKN